MTVGVIPTEKEKKIPFCSEVCNFIYIYIYIYISLCLCAVCRLSLCTSLQGLQELLLKGDVFEQVFFFFPFFSCGYGHSHNWVIPPRRITSPYFDVLEIQRKQLKPTSL
jgi:hypothetical protein